MFNRQMEEYTLEIPQTSTNEWNEIPVCYLLKNGIITSVYNSEEENELTYDKDKHLTKVNDDYTWTWSNGNIAKFVHEYNDYKQVKNDEFER